MGSSINHTDREHALLSASGSNRWLNCPPSARLEEKQMQSGSSVFSREGTLAHELADLKLRFKTGQIDNFTYRSELKSKKTEIIKFYEKESIGGDYEDMEYNVDIFVDIVMSSYNEFLTNDKHTEILLEQRLDYSDIVEGGFGTGDACVIGGKILLVNDLKFGKGVQVHAEKNSQLMLYGYGALLEHELLYEIEEIKLCITQPRLDHYSSWSISKDDLLHWGQKIVKPIAAKAYKGEGRKTAGSWCKFCKVSALCRTNADHNLKLAQYEFKDPDLLGLDELAKIMDQLPALEDWSKSIKDHLLKVALDGEKIPGYKLVNGKSQRTIINEEKVKKVLEEEGYSEDQYVNSKLAGITQIEKLVGKANIYDLIGDYIHKPDGKPTLAHESDPRPGIGGGGVEQALLDFQD